MDGYNPVHDIKVELLMQLFREDGRLQVYVTWTMAEGRASLPQPTSVPEDFIAEFTQDSDPEDACRQAALAWVSLNRSIWDECGLHPLSRVDGTLYPGERENQRIGVIEMRNPLHLGRSTMVN